MKLLGFTENLGRPPLISSQQRKSKKRQLAYWKRIAVVTLLATSVPTFAQTFRAGAGQADIETSVTMFPVAEFTGQHDPVSVRTLLLDDGSQQFAILTVDTPSIQNASIVAWKAILTKVTGIAPENTLVIGTHVTPSPHISSEAGPGGARQMSPADLTNAKAYAQAVDIAVESSATKAFVNLQPARVGFGTGTSRVNINRDVLTQKGWTVGYNDSGFTDPSLAMVRFNSLDGKPLAWLMDYAVRPAIMERSKTADGGALISGDIVGAARHNLEAQYGSGATALFLMGAAVDQSPLFMANRFVLDKEGNSSQIDIHEAGFALVDLLGERLGSAAVAVSEGINTSETPTKLKLMRQSVEVATQARQRPNSSAAIAAAPQKATEMVPFVILQIGNIALVGVVPELNAQIGVKIKTESPFPHTIVATMVDGSAKYLPDEASYDRKTPEALGSQFARGSAEAVVVAVETQLRKLSENSFR
jgi:hypothetical protein